MRLLKKQNDKKACDCINIPLGGMFFVFLCICLLTPFTGFSQNEVVHQDTLKNDTAKIKKHSPRLATIMSAVIPGLGQAYNKKYWKIPIIYVGLGTLGYFANRSNIRYKNFKNAYSELYSLNKDSTIMIYGTEYTLNGLDAGRNYYRRYRDLYVILTAGVYLLNIIDAEVDAHLFDFDISDDISMQVEPSVGEYCMAGTVTGIKIKINFK
jgi:hypothetical protein